MKVNSHTADMVNSDLHSSDFSFIIWPVMWPHLWFSVQEVEQLLQCVCDADSVQQVEQYGSALVQRLLAARQRRKEITAEEMKAVMMERDVCVAKVSHYTLLSVCLSVCLFLFVLTCLSVYLGFSNFLFNISVFTDKATSKSLI